MNPIAKQRQAGSRAMAALLLFTLVVAALPPGRALAFGEERGSNIDTHEHVSTHHLYLTRALAVCAGYATSGKADPFDAPQAAERIAIADQLSDSERLHYDSGDVTNCSAQAYVMPTPAALGCPADSGDASIIPVLGRHHVAGLLPVPTWQPEAGCFTSRFGPWSNDFHFPDAARVAVLRDWAFGKTPVLTGTARFSFGHYFDSPWGAGCYRTQSGAIDTGTITAGSLEALGIYLHAIGDFHSHAECLAHWDGRGNPPWPTHTISTAQTGCAFVDHARELGCPSNTAHDSLLTPPPGDVYVQHATDAAIDIYDELLRHARLRDVPARLGDSPAQREWLLRQVRRFVTGWSYLGGAEERRAFANRLATECAALLPDTVPAEIPHQENESNCPAAR